MAIKKCCVETCNSCSTRKEDYGVTFHKFPKDLTLHDIWMTVTHFSKITDLPTYVCSRHFCKNDFQLYKDTNKYVLKSDAIPSIFPWVKTDSDDNMESSEEDTIMSPVTAMESMDNAANKDSEIENIDAIKKFIEQQEKEILELQSSKTKDSEKKEVPENSDFEEKFSLDGTAIDNIVINESELEISKKKNEKPKILFSPDKGNNTTPLSIGTQVEAKDFSGEWYPAEITEVDFDEMEVLVHYEDDIKKLDEWISVNSSRLRPKGSGPTASAPTVKPGPSSAESLSDTVPISAIKEEMKEQREEKVKLTFEVGERCLARWRDNRRFIATVNKDLGSDSYEVIFDDGCVWKCKTTRLYKLKSEKGVSSEATPSSPAPGTGPSALLPAYHTHLFDPTRDYLPSKSERREMKRKLNIKEIFNIGQKKQKVQHSPKERPKKPAEKKPRVLKNVVKQESGVDEVKTEPAIDAVASIIGTVDSAEEVSEVKIEATEQEVDATQEGKEYIDDKEVVTVSIDGPCDIDEDSDDTKIDFDPVTEEEVTLEKFDKPDPKKHVEVIDRIKEAIIKLEDVLKTPERVSSPKLNLQLTQETRNEIEKQETVENDIKPTKVEPKESKENVPKIKELKEEPSVKPESSTEPLKSEKIEPKTEPSSAEIKSDEKQSTEEVNTEDGKPKKQTKVKKTKKLRLLREKKVKKQVEKVKNELEAMKKQMEEMRRQMLEKSREFKVEPAVEMPESFMLPGEWCCRWVNGQPVGAVSELQADAKRDPVTGQLPLPRRSVQVEDKRLPEGWTKHMVRRSLGHSAGKWDVVLVNPDNRRFHTKNEMRNYLEQNPALKDQGYEPALMDFGIHLKLSRRMGWITRTADGALPAPSPHHSSPLLKRKQKKSKLKLKIKKPKLSSSKRLLQSEDTGDDFINIDNMENSVEYPPLEDGYVYCGSLKVQIIETLLRCPAEGCYKNFRNTTLLQMHIKHYHRELRKMLGATPKVLDLAYARSRMPGHIDTPRPHDKVIKVKIPRPPKREEPKQEAKETKSESIELPTTPIKEPEFIPRSQDSPKLRQMLINKPVKRPKVLLPVRRPEHEVSVDNNDDGDFEDSIPEPTYVPLESLDFESAISTHTVTKPLPDKRRKGEKKRKSFALVRPYRPLASEEDDCTGINALSDVDTRSSFPRSGTPDSKIDLKTAPVSSESNEDMNKEANMYTYNENGERIKIVHMKREEIINCHCGIREEDGLMVQCELCLCWQHALCHNIQREADVPEKYTCSICLNPRRGRRSKRFLHDQDRMYEGLLPGSKPDESLRRSHELAGNLLRIEDALHALRVKYYVATKKNHPKLYLWAKDWEHAEIQYTQEKLNSDYSDLNIMISNLGKENLPIKPDDVRDLPMDIQTPPSEEHDRYNQREGALGSQSLLSGLLSSPGGASLDLPISTSELERLAKSVQVEQECAGVPAPVPEAAIENSACRERLLRHLQRCQALLDARLDSIEAQVAELESQDPSLQDDETADHYPRTKQTVQLLMRDLDTMEELGVIT